MPNYLKVNDAYLSEDVTKELFKALRSNVEFTGTENRAIAITSCRPNDGKSYIAFQMAKTFAQSGKNTVLIDADMRYSVLMKRLKTVEKIQGLSHYLSGQCQLTDVVCTTDVPNLFIIATGPFPPNPAELLEKKRFAELITALKKTADYVIIDTPPLGSVIDAAVIAKHCDGAILTIAADAISRRLAIGVKNQLMMANPNILGIILNMVKKNGGRSGYGYYKGYYGGYGGYGLYGSYGSYGVYGAGNKKKDGSE